MSRDRDALVWALTDLSEGAESSRLWWCSAAIANWIPKGLDASGSWTTQNLYLRPFSYAPRPRLLLP
jgi:hypothetical protein